jgi:hypothetical protein
MRALFVSLILFISCAAVVAQEIEFQVMPAASKVGTQDAFEVRYVIKNANRAQSFSLNELRDVQVVGGPSQSSNMSIMNGERSVSLEITYVFKAKRKGNIVLPVGIISIDGREYKSNAVAISVIEGTVRTQPQRRSRNPFDDPFFDQDPFEDDMFAAMQRQQQQMMQMLQRSGGMRQMMPQQRQSQNAAPPQAEITKDNLGNNLFIKVDVDRTQAIVGEQVTASYKLYTRVPMEINLTKLPSLNGFWSQDFKLPQIPKPTLQVVNGKEYQVFEIKRTALFPTQSGILELDPAEASGMARILKPKRVRQENPFGDDPVLNHFFGSMMMSDPDFDNQYMTTYDYEDVKVNLKSIPIKINVSALSETNRPPSFNGAIGSYTLESTIDKTELSTDDVASITFKISGTGNLKLMNAPNIQFPNEINAFDVEQSDTITNRNNIIAGYKKFTYSFAPQSAGTFTIPATDFSYYDPELKQYKTLTSPSYVIHVRQGKDLENSSAKLPSDIHDIHSKVRRIEKSKPVNLPTSPLYWGGFALPMLAYISLLAFRRKEDKLQENVVLFKNKKANKIALKRLETAERYLKMSAQNSFYEETSKAVWLYLSDKLGIPLSTLSKEVAIQKLSDKKVSAIIQEELFRVTDECEMALYAPETGSMRMHQTYSDAYKLIGKLEDELS